MALAATAFAFAHEDSTDNDSIVVADLASSSSHAIVSTGDHVTGVAVSPDRKWIAYTVADAVLMIGVDGSSPHQVSDPITPPVGYEVALDGPEWSPDGGTIAHAEAAIEQSTKRVGSDNPTTLLYRSLLCKVLLGDHQAARARPIAEALVKTVEAAKADPGTRGDARFVLARTLPAHELAHARELAKQARAELVEAGGRKRRPSSSSTRGWPTRARSSCPEATRHAAGKHWQSAKRAATDPRASPLGDVKTICLLVITMVSFARVARADDDPALIAADRAPQWEAAIAMNLGSFHTATVTNLAVGLDLAGGLRLGRLAVLGEYRLMRLSAFPASGDAAFGSSDSAALSSSPSGTWQTPSGFVQRFGLDARYSLLEVLITCKPDEHCAMRSDVWFEAGLGEQLIRWNDGGQLQRPDIGFGLGGSIGGRGPDHHGNFFVGLRMTFARPPSGPPLPSTCAGPCDSATPPVGIDRSVLFTMGLAFGS